MISDRYDIYPFTGAVALSETIAPGGGEFRLAGFSYHAGGVSANEAISFTTDAESGAAYDTEIYSVSLNALTDKISMIPVDERIPLKAGDEIDIAWANTNTETYGVKVFIERE